MDFAYRVHVLLRKGPRGSVGNYFYVGIAWAKDIKDRLPKHFGGGDDRLRIRLGFGGDGIFWGC